MFPRPLYPSIVDAKAKIDETIETFFVFFSDPLPEPATGTQEITKLDVFNVAALALGLGEGVSDPDENSAVAAIFRRRWDSVRQSFLEEHTWNGAKRTEILVKKDTIPVDRWGAMFTIPRDCLRVVTINGFNQNDGTDPWEVEVDLASGERVIMTDSATCKAVMIVDIVDLARLKTKVIEAMGLYLAYHVSSVFPMSGDMLGFLRQKLEHAMAIAKGADGQEGTPPERNDGFLVREMRTRRSGARRRRIP